jgi:adenine-specific DNA-methyltransferase
MTLQNLDYERSHTVNFTEAQRLVEQSYLDAAKDSLARNRLGQFATPNALALNILQYAKSLLPANKSIHFLDPAIGTGSFYSALLQSYPLEQIQSAVGYEIDQDCAEVAVKLWAGTPLRLNIADFTESTPPQDEDSKANLLICNPPYVRHHHLSREKKVILKQLGMKAAGIELSGLAGLYCYFLLAAHQWMAQDGLACWLVPSEFMDVNYGAKIKEYLLEQVTLLRVHRFAAEDLQFSDVLVSTAVIWFRNTKPDDDHSVDFTHGGSINHPTVSETLSSRMLKKRSKWNTASISSTHKSHTQSETKLSDLFDIKRGIATGANDFFILTHDQVIDRHIPSEFLVPIFPSPRYLLNDEVFADEQGNPSLERKLFLLTCKQPIEWIQVKHPSVWDYLQQGEKLGISDRYLCKHRSLWYMQETRDPAMFLCPYMGRQQARNGKPFRFILNHSRAIAPNVYLMIYPKTPLATLLAMHPERIKAVWQALNAIPIQELIQVGRVYGDGLHKLEPRELANAPADLVLSALNQVCSEGLG